MARQGGATRPSVTGLGFTLGQRTVHGAGLVDLVRYFLDLVLTLGESLDSIPSGNTKEYLMELADLRRWKPS